MNIKIKIINKNLDIINQCGNFVLRW